MPHLQVMKILNVLYSFSILALLLGQWDEHPVWEHSVPALPKGFHLGTFW